MLFGVAGSRHPKRRQSQFGGDRVQFCPELCGVGIACVRVAGGGTQHQLVEFLRDTVDRLAGCLHIAIDALVGQCQRGIAREWC
ncbi:Uncharacterised protein [Mycobacteroides abscessus subsp. massiliense]|nr:Uncharacterised protein [Mycobacteroides abscessus subsp. massiliense]